MARALKKIREHSMTTNPDYMPHEGYCIWYPNGWMLSVQTSEQRDDREHGLYCSSGTVEVSAWYRGTETKVVGKGLDRRVVPVDTDLWKKEQVKGYVSVEKLVKLMYLLSVGNATDARRLLQ